MCAALCYNIGERERERSWRDGTDGCKAQIIIKILVYRKLEGHIKQSKSRKFNRHLYYLKKKKMAINFIAENTLICKNLHVYCTYV